MATIKSSLANGVVKAPSPSGQEVISLKVSVSLLAAQVAINNVVQLAILPADCVPVGYVVGASDLDTNAAPAVTFDLGVLDAAGTAISADAADGGAKWLAASTLAQGGGIALHTASKTAYDVVGAVQADSGAERIIAIVFAAGAATGANGTVELELFYKSA